MRRLDITDPARTDLGGIRKHTLDRYGARGLAAYTGLLKQALRDLREDPLRLGSKARPEIGANIRSYHIRSARVRAGANVKSPRHFILYFVPDEETITISRVLHESSDLPRHLPESHREAARKAAPVRKGRRKEPER